MCVNKRIEQIILHYNLNKNSFSGKLGLKNNTTIGQIVSGRKSKPSFDVLNKIVETFPEIDSNWLLTGKGEMFLESISQVEDSPISYTNGFKKGVPYYDIDVSASIQESFQDVAEEPDMYIDFKPFNDCSAYLPIYGDSMYPQFASGEIVALKIIKNIDIIMYGEPYLIITNEEADNLRTLKILRKHEDDDKIILKPSNPNFDETVIPKNAIVNLYLVKGKITRKQL